MTLLHPHQSHLKGPPGQRLHMTQSIASACFSFALALKRLVQFLPYLAAARCILEVHGIVLARRRRTIFSWAVLLKLFHLDKAEISATIEKQDLICICWK